MQQERRGFGDETWRLAQAGDAEGLRRAADLIGDDVPYDSHRARAFAFAAEGRVDQALAQLNEGWTEEWPFPAAYATDVARVRYLAGDYADALSALGLSVRGSERRNGVPAELAAACVRRERRLWWPALRVALSGGSPMQRSRVACAVVGARLGRNP